MPDRLPVSAEELVTEIVERLREIDANDEAWSGIYARGARLIESEFAGRYPGLRLVRNDEATVEQALTMARELVDPLDETPFREGAAWILAVIEHKFALTAAQGAEDG